ncbi:hypothetical protein HD553DRAFT_316660 [Filobasidium floriforme]|uniref:uncharacterized protein n=1 Tax=Filobasidium floriforme TaxID=5210 RepID=UPI001E8CCD4D|nr:uncharacterized protein HD553DRAFT_316660 [Filobasidium floriforme]KAH8080905.1 hypothetical protein HD553DRAFT_316660 [Filobasidium floriforme]
MSNKKLGTPNSGQMTQANWDVLFKLKTTPCSYQDIRDAVDEFEGKSKGKKQRTWTRDCWSLSLSRKTIRLWLAGIALEAIWMWGFTRMGHVQVIIPGLIINLAQWLWPILDADERDYVILEQILVTLSILGAITICQVYFPDGVEKVMILIAGKD